MLSHWSLKDIKSPRVSRILLNILSDLNNAVVWMVSTHPLISKSTSPFNNLRVNVLRTPVTIGHFHVPKFFQFPNKVKLFIFLYTIFQFYSMVNRDSKVHNSASSLVFADYHKVWWFGRDRWSLCTSKSERSFCVSFFRTDSGLCIYHLFAGSNYNF